MQPDDLLEHGVQLLEERVVTSRRVIRANRLEIPERGVDGVVLGRFAGVGKVVRQHPAVHESRERREDPARDVGPAGRQREAG